MLKSIYHHLTRQPRWVKNIASTFGKVGIRVLSMLKGFTPAEKLSVMSYQMLLGTWDAGVSSLLKKVLKPGMTVIDVGAHVGYFALEASKLVGNTGHVHAFEPNEENREKLLFNVRRRNNITCHHEAVSDRVGTLTFYDSSSGSGSNSLVETRGEYKAEHVVSTTTIDAFLNGAPADLIKIDVEGAEHFVLTGMEKTAQEGQQLHIIIELYPALFVRQGLPPHTILSKLNTIGFVIHTLDDETGNISEPIPPETFERFAAQLPTKYINLYAHR